jgi:hypothetical protein
MATAEGEKLAQIIRQKVEEMERLCQGLDEATASKAPEGRWSPKEIISHLLGPEGAGMMAGVRAILDQDTPLLEMEAADPFFSERRSRMTMAELMAELKKEYGQMAEAVSGLSAEQLARKARIPMLKDSPLGEFPTLKAFVEGLADYHVGSHIKHMGEILAGLDVKTS